MKRDLLLYVLALLPEIGKAQTVPLVMEGKEWTMLYELVVNPSVYENRQIYYKMTLVGDTVIADIPFKQIFEKHWWKHGEEEPAQYSATYGYLGEKDGRIYSWYAPNPMTPECVMDFSLQSGDAMSLTDYNDKFVVKAVSDTIILNSTDQITRKCLYINYIDNEERNDVWIEGIGSVCYGLDGLKGFVSSGSRQKLIRCVDSGVCIFDEDDDVSLLSRLKAQNANTTIYDLQGHRLQDEPDRGFYIVDGKKFIK